MRPRYNTTQARHHRYTFNGSMPQLEPRLSRRSERAPSAPCYQPTGNEIPITELNGFALTCIERLAFPGEGKAAKSESVEDTIASVMIDKLPSYTTAKATLVASLGAQSENHVWSSPLQTNIAELRMRVEHMQEVIAHHLIQTGEEIGLPKPLLVKLADLTQAILSRYAE